MDDVQQMIVNEVRRLERVIEKRVKALEQLQSKTPKQTRPRRYVIEYVVPVGGGQSSLNQPITRSFVVDRDCSVFICQEIAYSVAAVGEIRDVANSNKLTLSPNLISETVSFTWRIRDTATDREWQNVPLPSYFLASGLTSGLGMPCPASILPGAETEVTVVPTALNGSFSLTAITSFTFQISFVGFEVL